MSIKNIAFRTDASSQIGTGHFMRCLTLADALKKQGAQIRFVCRDLPVYLRDILAEKGHELALLDNDQNPTPLDELVHSHWLGISQVQDAAESIQALSDKEWDWLIVDHYALDVRWERALRGAAKHILVIDDIADRQHDCDILLDQNLYADMETRYVGKVPTHSQLLLGPRFALLREEFRKLREQIKPRTGSIKKLLVFFGGVDAGNYTGLAIEALAQLPNKEIQVDVVIGTQHPYRAQIEAACVAHGYACHVQTNQMAELMAGADLVIGAGGSATWERCCLGLPALSICVADNQRKQIIDSAEAGLLYAPSNNSNIVTLIQRHTNALLENPALLKFISANAAAKVDGNGVHRIASAMGISCVEMRVVNEDDSKKLFEWRNHPRIRFVSNNAAPIPWGDHQAWFASALANRDRVLLIGLVRNEPVGVVRFDKANDFAEVSIYLVPEGDFAGQGRSLLLSAEHWLRVNRPDIKCIRAVVLGGNVVSQNLFQGANYRLEKNSYLKEL